MKERYVLSYLCKRLISYSLWSRVEKDRNNFRIDFSEDEIHILVDLMDKRLEELGEN